MKVKLCPWVNSELFVFLFLKNKITKIKLTSGVFFSLLVVVFGGFFCNKKQNLQGSKSILERRKEVIKLGGRIKNKSRLRVV